MKTYLIPAILAPLYFSSCEEKHVTVNPAGETKTTIIKEAPNTTEKKTETETKTGPDGTVIEKKETTEKK